MSDVHICEVAATSAGERLDRFLAAALEGLSRSRVKSLIKAGQVRQHGATIVEPNRRVKPGECYEITIPPAQPAEPRGEDIPLDIVFEDADLLVLDKPAGLVVHPAAGNWTGTLVNALIAHCGDSLSGIGGVRRPGIVHRLDKDTTGLMVVAKNDRAHQGLAAQFADHGRTGQLVRRYLALVWGAPRQSRGRICNALARQRNHRQKMAVVSVGGKQAITEYEVQACYGLPAGEQNGTGVQPPILSLLTCRLLTGRTHQIRVHMAHLGHPLVGDRLYGSSHQSKSRVLPAGMRALFADFPRQALHAATLGFVHPGNGELMSFESALPQDMAQLVNVLEGLEIAK